MECLVWPALGGHIASVQVEMFMMFFSLISKLMPDKLNDFLRPTYGEASM